MVVEFNEKAWKEFWKYETTKTRRERYGETFYWVKGHDCVIHNGVMYEFSEGISLTESRNGKRCTTDTVFVVASYAEGVEDYVTHFHGAMNLYDENGKPDCEFLETIDLDILKYEANSEVFKEYKNNTISYLLG